MARFNVSVVATSAACLAVLALALAAETTGKAAPARVEDTGDAKIKKITLTPKAAERLGVLQPAPQVGPVAKRRANLIT